MAHKRQSVADLAGLEQVKQLATPANFGYGQAIYRRGGVEFIEFEVRRVEAWVGGLDGTVKEGGGQRRRTELVVSTDGLTWHCAGNPKNHQIFCKHCVALALATRKKTPKHR